MGSLLGSWLHVDPSDSQLGVGSIAGLQQDPRPQSSSIRTDAPSALETNIGLPLAVA